MEWIAGGLSKRAHGEDRVAFPPERRFDACDALLINHVEMITQALPIVAFALPLFDRQALNSHRQPEAERAAPIE
jgi:hypothetical protein